MATVLVRLLAQGDVLVLPMREWGANRPGATWLARRDYAAHGGLRWQSFASTEAGRKRAQRVVEALATSGLATTAGARGKAVRVKLTPEGETLATALCGIGDAPTAWDYMHRLAKFQKRTPGIIAAAGETAFHGKWGDGVAESSLLWALRRGHVVCSTTTYGHAFYGLCESGWKLVNDPAWTRPEMDFSCHDLKWTDVYVKAVKEAQARIDQIDPHGEIGGIPMPMSAGKYIGIASEYREGE